MSNTITAPSAPAGGGLGLLRSELPRLSMEERDQRWAAIRREMSLAGIDCLLVHGDSGKWDQKSSSMRYVGQIGGNGEDGWLVFPAEGDPTAFVFSGGAMLQMWSDLQDWVTDVRSAPGLIWSNALTQGIEERGLSRARLGIVGLEGYQESEGTASYLTVSRLKERFPDADFVDATRLVEDLRMYKSAEELTFIQEAARIGDTAIEVMRAHARPGVPELEVYARTMESLMWEGSEQPVTFFWDAGDSVSHAQRFAGRRILQESDVIVTEISPRYYGHWVQFSAPAVVGRPTAQYQRLFDVAYESYQEAFAIFRPGATLGDLAVAFERPIVAAGMYSQHVYAHGTGGRGSEFPVIFPPSRRVGMPPAALENFERLMEIEVKEGMVLAFEPHVTEDGVHGIHIGDPVVAMADGPRSLSRSRLDEWISVG